MLGRFNEDLSMLKRAIRWGDGDDPVRAVHPHPRHPSRHRREGQDEAADFGRTHSDLPQRPLPRPYALESD